MKISCNKVEETISYHYNAYQQRLLIDCRVGFDTALNLLSHSQTGIYDETAPR